MYEAVQILYQFIIHLQIKYEIICIMSDARMKIRLASQPPIITTIPFNLKHLIFE